jgi:hypothetical protein
MRRAVPIALLGALALAAPATATVRACHPTGHVLAHHKTVVFWRVRRGSQTRVYVCAPPTNRPELVALGGKYLFPGVGDVQSAGRFVSFFYYTHFSYIPHLIVFDLKRARREFTQASPASVYQDPLRYFLAPNGWVAEALLLGTSPPDPFLQEDQLLFATNDGQSFYTIDVLSFSPLTLDGKTLGWSSSFGGSSSANVGRTLVPALSPSPLSPCQVITADDVAAKLGQSSSMTSAGRCTYASTFTPGMTLTVNLQTGLSPSQQSAAETALRTSGWDGLASEVGEFHQYQNSATVGGVVHQQLDAFYGGVELSLDLAAPGTEAAEFMAWLGNVGLDRLFSVAVTRAS